MLKISLLIVSHLMIDTAFAQQSNDQIELKYKNKGVNLYTTNSIYSSKWQEYLDIALDRYTSLIGSPSPINLYVVENSNQVGKLKQPNQPIKQLILPLETIALKNKHYTTQYATANHELCHLWFMNTLEEKGLTQQPDPMGMPSYGHANAPDWLDESVATHCEQGQIEASRFTSLNNPTPLKSFLEQENPVFAMLKEKLLAAIQQNNGEQVIIKEEVSDEHLTTFYQQASWFKQFIITHLGKDGYKNIVDQLVQKEDISLYLLSSLGFNNWSDAESAFHQFIKLNKPPKNIE